MVDLFGSNLGIVLALRSEEPLFVEKRHGVQRRGLERRYFAGEQQTACEK
ncbi:hypothetical protein [Paenibacillus sp. sgz500992]